MNEFENNNQNDSLSGFDSVDDNLYSKKSKDIIQDPVAQDIPQYTAPPTYTTPNVNTKPQKDKKRKSSRSFIPSIITILISGILAIVISVISGVTVLGVAIIVTSDDETTTPQQIIDKIESETDSNSTNVNINIDETASSIAEAVATKCSDSVVGIRTTTSVSNFFGGSSEQTGDGSGVIYTKDGYIITNYHVISDAVQSNASKIDVFIGNNKSESYPATVIGYNISCDLAVIKIDAEGLTPIELGDSDNIKIGQQVITIGAPGGIEFMGSVTSGIISGLDRVVSTNSELKLIQTDAAINPGNSGGALLDATGKLIGINSSKIASVEYEGMGFAIPVNTVKEKCDKIISRKDDGQAYLGVSISATYTSEVLAFYGYPSGAVVSSVAEGSPAAIAGIERGDIITKFNGIAISEYTMLNELLYDCKAGDTISITIYRSGRYYTADIKLTAETSN
ncbi:MAG: trypsin-like peptidase domain-containing protein [Clostridia bacterium]|nr:trypsin-like peptidase domain-containing protein [Clostridia bacterium]